MSQRAEERRAHRIVAEWNEGQRKVTIKRKHDQILEAEWEPQTQAREVRLSADGNMPDRYTWQWISLTIVSGLNVDPASVRYLDIHDNGTATYHHANQPESDVGLWQALWVLTADHDHDAAFTPSAYTLEIAAKATRQQSFWAGAVEDFLTKTRERGSESTHFEAVHHGRTRSC